jgi:hypothetical protein
VSKIILPDNSFVVHLPQFADGMNTTVEVLTSEFLSNGFSRQKSLATQYAQWSRPDFTRFPEKPQTSKLQFDRLDQSAARKANADAADLLRQLFGDSEALSTAEFEEQLFRICPPLFGPGSDLKTAFGGDCVTRTDFVSLFAHFGPVRSLLAKCGQVLAAQSAWPSLQIADHMV